MVRTVGRGGRRDPLVLCAGAERSKPVIELAGWYGWTDEPSAVIAYGVLGGTL